MSDSTRIPPNSREEILGILRRELSELELELPPEIAEGARFQKDLGLDSLALAVYIACLEQVFQVEIPDEEWQRLTTLGLAADYVERWYAELAGDEQGEQPDPGL